MWGRGAGTVADGAIKAVALAALCLGLAAAPAAQGSPYVYVANRSSNDISQYDATFGTLSPLSPATVAAGTGPSAVAVTPDGRHAYVTRFNQQSVAQYSIGADGTLHPKSPATVPAGTQPTAIAVSPDGRNVYVKNFFASFASNSTVSQYSVQADGRLTPKVPSQVAAGDGGDGDVVVSPDSLSVYVTNRPNSGGDLSISQYSADANGALTPKSPARVGVAGGPFDVAVHPDGQTVYVSTCCNGIRQYAVGAGGTLTPKTPASAAGSGNALAVSPDGQSAYAADFNVVFQYSIGADGSLSPKTPASVAAGNTNRDIVISPDGTGAYVANVADTVLQFSVGAGGVLSPRSPSQVPTGSAPAALAITEGHSVDPPTAAITTPANGVTYDIGESLTTAFTCTPSLGGPAIVSCLDQDGDPPGKAIDTSAPRTSSLTVTATAADGQTGTRTSSYSVAQLNDDPVAQDVSVTTGEDDAVSFTIDVTDPDGDTTFSAEPTTSPAHGSATCSVLTCTYTPVANYHGSDSFVVRVSDGHGGADLVTVSVTVTAVNDAPVAGVLDVSTTEGVDVGFTLPATDVDGDALTYAVVQPPPGRGSVTCDGAVCTYHADPDYCCTTTINFTASDPDGATDDGAVQIDITAVNDPPTATDQHVLLDEDTSVTFGLDVSDPDDAAALAATITDGPDHGEASCTGRVCTYTPAPDFSGEDAFAYTVTDPGGASASATVSFTVRSVNAPPVAQDEPVVTDEDTNRAVTLGATDPDGGELIFNHGQPAHGGLSCTTSTACTYDPDTNYNGPDAFEFTVTDDHGATDTGTVSITVRPVNDAPNAIGQSLSTDEDTEITFGLDVSDLDGDALSATVSADPTRGSASCSGTTCTYVPDENLHGEDGFAYVVSDGHGGTATATVFVTVRPVGDAPVAQDQNVSVFEDAGVTFTLGATDADGDALTYTPAAPAHGTLECTGSGCLYAPADDYHGDDAFTFTVSDGNGGADTGRVDITVEPINDAPVAEDRGVTVAEDDSVTFSITAGDVDGDTLSAEVSGDPSHGTATCAALSCTYEPTGNYTGSDAFVVAVSDGKGATDFATVAVTVTPVNDAPTAQNVTVATDEDTAVQLALLGGDIDGDALTYAVTGTGPQHGTATCAGALCTYTPAENYHGPDSFTYRVSDSSGASASASVSITVDSVVDATTLSVPPLLRILTQPLLKLTIPFEARLVRSPGGQPLAGRTITFVAGGQPRCSAVTNAHGIATCTATLPSLLSALLGLGYTAVFDGDTVYAGSSGKGVLIA